MIIGGCILEYLGGYNGPHTTNLCLFFGVLSSSFAIPIPYFDSPYLIVSLLWLMMFSGGGLMPALMGYMISSLKKNKRAFGNGIAMLV